MTEKPDKTPTLDYATPPAKQRSRVEVPIGCLISVLAPFAALMLFLGVGGCIAMITDSRHFDGSETGPTFARLIVGAFAGLICIGAFRESRKPK